MYFCRGTILLKYSTLIFIFLLTCNAWMIESYYCPASACGHIHNISYPFRLNTDPEYCGDDPAFELACEGNQTVISLFSKKLYVQDINYNNKTIHLVDPTLQTQDDLCSLRPHPNFNQYFIISKSYYQASTFAIHAEPIFRFNCPIAAYNSSTFLEIRGCKFSRYTYIKTGDMCVGEVSDGCRAEFIGLTSWPNIYVHGENNISLSDFHQAILHGFELGYYPLSSRPRGFPKIVRTSLLQFHGVLENLIYDLHRIFGRKMSMRLHYFTDRILYYKIDDGASISTIDQILGTGMWLLSYFMGNSQKKTLNLRLSTTKYSLCSNLCLKCLPPQDGQCPEKYNNIDKTEVERKLFGDKKLIKEHIQSFYEMLFTER